MRERRSPSSIFHYSRVFFTTGNLEMEEEKSLKNKDKRAETGYLYRVYRWFLVYDKQRLSWRIDWQLIHLSRILLIIQLIQKNSNILSDLDTTRDPVLDPVSTVNVVGTRDLPRALECSRIQTGPVNNGSWRMSRVGTKKKKEKKKKGKGGKVGRRENKFECGLTGAVRRRRGRNRMIFKFKCSAQ